MRTHFLYIQTNGVREESCSTHCAVTCCKDLT